MIIPFLLDKCMKIFYKSEIIEQIQYFDQISHTSKKA